MILGDVTHERQMLKLVLIFLHKIIMRGGGKFCPTPAKYHAMPLNLGYVARRKDAFSYNVMKIKNHHNKNPDIFAFHIFGLKCCLHP